MFLAAFKKVKYFTVVFLRVYDAGECMADNTGADIVFSVSAIVFSQSLNHNDFLAAIKSNLYKSLNSSSFNKTLMKFFVLTQCLII